MSHENEINEARALCFDVHTDCLWVISLIETKMKKSIKYGVNLFFINYNLQYLHTTKCVHYFFAKNYNNTIINYCSSLIFINNNYK